MKQTEADRLFAQKFAKQLEPYILREQSQGKSLTEIAADLGVTAPGMKKQLAGGTPSVRTVALAYLRFQVAVPYENVDVAQMVTPRKSSKIRRVKSSRQLKFPFDISTPDDASAMEIKIKRKGPQRYRLEMHVRIAE